MKNMDESYNKPELRLIRPKNKEDEDIGLLNCEVLPDRSDAVNFLCALAESELLNSDIADALGAIAYCIRAEEITLNLWGCQRADLEELFTMTEPQSMDERECADLGNLMYEHSLAKYLEDFMEENGTEQTLG